MNELLAVSFGGACGGDGGSNASSSDATQKDFLYERLLTASAREVGVVRDALEPFRNDVTGKLWAVAEQQDAQQLRAAEWSGRDGDGRSAPAGIYFARLAGGRPVAATRFVLAR